MDSRQDRIGIRATRSRRGRAIAGVLALLTLGACGSLHNPRRKIRTTLLITRLPTIRMSR